ncbi:putative camp/cgmp cyclic nucleotide phosphodiesterase [Schistosoma mansoni]|uniref:putative camp/cgmp cyclic nucleotide phosphodiesterase n=1 Tax=Schistosoma mansoni TaxID=6183 RepID=UPI00019B376D|nr:putative camp/cgmp cyclic nucleotide phosphodiesterase [Schistosoma mansoni]|eukprot:XP_018653795.1 putative camp/cgmp cyclic nucleotide phosphodiesterase [Schistosoma mansoni]
MSSLVRMCELCGGHIGEQSELSFEDMVTNWLDENPEFTFKYFVKSASPSMVEAWANGRNHGEYDCLFDNSITVMDEHNDKNDDKTPVTTSLSLPIRKISSQDLELTYDKRILSSNEDGKPTFINSVFFPFPSNEHIDSNTSSVRQTVASPSRPTHLTERDLISELALDICRELDVTSLSFKIVQNVCRLINADRGSFFLVEKSRSTGEDVLVSKLFDITPECIFDDVLQRCSSNHIIVPFNVGVTGYVARTGDYANIPDAYADPRFDDSVDRVTGYKTRCLLCMPIKNVDGKVLGVALVINKKVPSDQHHDQSINSVQPSSCESESISKHASFTEEDVKIFQSYVTFCGIGLHNAQIYEQSRLETYRNQVLLELARIIFSEQLDITRLIYSVLSHTICLLQCQRCQLLLVKTTSSMSSYSSIDEVSNYMPNHRLPRRAMLYGVGAGWKKARGGQTKTWHKSMKSLTSGPGRVVLAVCIITNKSTVDLRINNNNFSQQVTRHFDFKPVTDNVQCSSNDNLSSKEPVTMSTSINDWSGIFTYSDEFLFEAFALFVGLGISNSQLYEKAIRSAAKQKVIMDVLSYHATAPTSEAKRLATSLIPTMRFYHLDKFSFTDVRLSDEDTLKACIRMFQEMNFMKSIHFDQLSFARWLLSVRKNYREVTYHNWRHAFNVTQTMFCILLKGDFQSVFTDLECLALLTACLSHDIDHRGTDNQFQIKTMSPLAKLYSTSVLEHHHFNQEAILATDLSRYFARLPKFQQTLHHLKEINDQSTNLWRNDREQRLLLGCMFMTACDVSAITKPWPVQKLTAEMVANEFFEQGDLEKERLNVTPAALMDRERSNELPKLQVSFIDSICVPIYEAIVQVSPNFEPLLKGCKRNRTCWLILSENGEVDHSLYGLNDESETIPGTSTETTAKSITTTTAEGSTQLENVITSTSNIITSLGTLNPDSAERIAKSKPFTSSNIRRASVSSMTTVGGQEPPIQCQSSVESK